MSGAPTGIRTRVIGSKTLDAGPDYTIGAIWTANFVM